MEWYDATHSNERTQASYILDTLLPLKEAGVLELINGDTTIFPGIKVELTGGHTRGHQVVLIESEGKKAIYLADLVPTSSHIRLPYVMGYDLYPLDTINKKKSLLSEAYREHALLIFEHDPNTAMCYLEENWVRDGTFRCP
jgi:glyoxylase-like metal-dependent hydrolase (beta-lactamase superfamily II)